MGGWMDEVNEGWMDDVLTVDFKPLQLQSQFNLPTAH